MTKSIWLTACALVLASAAPACKQGSSTSGAGGCTYGVESDLSTCECDCAGAKVKLTSCGLCERNGQTCGDAGSAADGGSPAPTFANCITTDAQRCVCGP